MKILIGLSLCLIIFAAGCKKSSNNAQSNNRSSNSTSQIGTKIPFASGPLLGKWKDKGYDLTMEFHADGTYTNIATGQSSVYTYEYISDKMIKDTSPKGVVHKGRFEVNGDQMTMTWIDTTGSEAPSQTFERVDKK
jgi:hypothetical protein